MRCSPLLVLCLGLLAATPVPPPVDPHYHDFDFEFGPTWAANLRLLNQRLVGSHTWVVYHGTLISHPLWNGRGNVSELDVSNPAHGKIVGGALHLYNPDTHEWSVWFANEASGTLGVPSVGRFENGRGVLYDREPYHGRTVYVRQVFSNMSAHTFDFEQAFSADNGKTWETNLIIRYTR